MKEIRSSYKLNNYGQILRILVLAHKPKVVVECGVLDGYSTCHIAHALRFNYMCQGIDFRFDAYDLFEDYPFKHGIKEQVEKMLISQTLDRPKINLHKRDAFDAAKEYKSNEVDFLHFDISNTGDILLAMLENWSDKISKNGIIAFEGGSSERDEVEWMKEHSFTPIREVLMNHKEMDNWNFQILLPFPSMTLLFKRRR